MKIANAFSSDIKIGKKEKLINGKSVIGIMSIAVAYGEVVTLEADGADEGEAVEACQALGGRRGIIREEATFERIWECPQDLHPAVPLSIYKGRNRFSICANI
ncbi:HPr family phosphocarrier protein [Ammoniphilus sp. YIM 78166]|uniref:HPr family phosphocarrier protein n=1 Tax=Ammoniphilus sp. YIM 78166 TaxID=1644106 RepID=UPI001F10525B|nr:HPr family phosphocarrier protein [Ammoniphilus sp. YIM 78166]